jgi:hypothetical protein
VAAGCGAVRWAVQIGKERVAWKKWDCFRLGVASDFFSGYTETWRVLSWFFENSCMVANGQQQGDKFHPEPFPSGDVVTFELERAPGADGVLRVQVAGKTPRELKGLPRDGMLYPIVCMCEREQSYTMVAHALP